MKISAGILIVLRNEKVLLCHPTNSNWNSTYSPPKGIVNGGERIIDAAIRETFEETSIVISENMISNKSPIEIDYVKSGKVYKKVYLYRVDISSIDEIGIESEVIDKRLLQIDEIDWAGFLNKSESTSKIFKRLEGVLDTLWK